MCIHESSHTKSSKARQSIWPLSQNLISSPWCMFSLNLSLPCSLAAPAPTGWISPPQSLQELLVDLLPATMTGGNNPTQGCGVLLPWPRHKDFPHATYRIEAKHNCHSNGSISTNKLNCISLLSFSLFNQAWLLLPFDHTLFVLLSSVAFAYILEELRCRKA